MPNIPDVHWNFGAAGEAQAALRRAAAELRSTSGDRARAAQQAAAQWRGPHREHFDDYLRRALREAEQLAQRYEEAAARIARASERAREEQRRREREREHEREHERAAQRRNHSRVS
jgi:uncharacterized protein YukE